MSARGLSELAEQIEHFRGNVLVDHALIGGPQGVADLARGRPLAATDGWRFFGFFAAPGLAPALNVFVVLKAQNLLPLTARSAVPAATWIV